MMSIQNRSDSMLGSRSFHIVDIGLSVIVAGLITHMGWIILQSPLWLTAITLFPFGLIVSSWMDEVVKCIDHGYVSSMFMLVDAEQDMTSDLVRYVKGIASVFGVGAILMFIVSVDMVSLAMGSDTGELIRSALENGFLIFLVVVIAVSVMFLIHGEVRKVKLKIMDSWRG